MKSILTRLLIAALLLAGLAGCQSAHIQPPDGRVTVLLHEPDNFTDARDRAFGSTERHVLDGIISCIQEEVGRVLPTGQTMKITVTDIDLAGDFEPWRRHPGAYDVRIVKSNYPPRLRLSYVRTGADGQVLDQGEETITNLAFQMRTGIRSDSFFYERELVRDWIRRKLR